MSLTTFSTLYYGHVVSADNNSIAFDEGGPELIAEIDVGSYTLTDYVLAVQDALNNTGALTYTATLDRVNRLVTISATGTFALLVSTGSTVGTSAYPMIGFSGTDRTAAATYQGNLGSGSEYRPQYILQDFIPSTNYKRNVLASVNESASGIIEVVRFGNVRFTQFNIMYITNLPMDGKLIRNNPNGVSDLNLFMDYITNANPIEFMPDVSDRNTFQDLIIESTTLSKDGIEYKLKELYDKGLPNFFESGLLSFRVLN